MINKKCFMYFIITLLTISSLYGENYYDLKNRVKKAIALRNSGKYKEAIEEFEYVLTKKQNSKNLKNQIIKTYNDYGLSLLNNKKYLKAKKQFTRAIDFSPNEGIIFFNRASANLYLGQKLEGEKDLKKAISMNLDDNMRSRCYLSMGRLLKKRDEFQEAVDNFEKALTYKKTATIYAELAHAYYFLNDFRNAKYYLEEALDLESNNQHALYLKKKLLKEGKIKDDYSGKTEGFFKLYFQEDMDSSKIDELTGILRDTRDDIGRELGLKPRFTVNVIFYKTKDYKNALFAPIWSAGLYDGKIRIPFKNYIDDVLKQVIRHEYTHLINKHIGKGRIPTWLDEGIAQYMELKEFDANRKRRIKSIIKKDKKLLSFKNLENSFRGIGDYKTILKAYYQSLAAVDYIISYWGFSTLKNLIEEFNKQDTAEDALYEILGKQYEKFEENLLERIEDY